MLYTPENRWKWAKKLWKTTILFLWNPFALPHQDAGSVEFSLNSHLTIVNTMYFCPDSFGTIISRGNYRHWYVTINGGLHLFGDALLYGIIQHYHHFMQLHSEQNKPWWLYIQLQVHSNLVFTLIILCKTVQSSKLNPNIICILSGMATITRKTFHAVRPIVW